jgi:hypothetical protein
LTLLRAVWTFGRFLAGLPAFLAERMSLAEATAIVRQRLGERDRNFSTFCKAQPSKTRAAPIASSSSSRTASSATLLEGSSATGSSLRSAIVIALFGVALTGSIMGLRRALVPWQIELPSQR